MRATRSRRALAALTIAPETFTPEAAIYLGLRSIFFQLANARSDDDLREVAQRLWAMAVQIEDGNVSDAEAAIARRRGGTAPGAGTRSQRRGNQVV